MVYVVASQRELMKDKRGPKATDTPVIEILRLEEMKSIGKLSQESLRHALLYSAELPDVLGQIPPGLNSRLYRIQTCHDCMRVEESWPVPVGCPQLPIQRNLITHVLEHTNKAHTGTTLRTVTDPESTTEEQHHLVRGSNTGVDWTKSHRHDPERREMMSIQWDRDLVRDAPAVVPTAEHGRADNDQLDLQDRFYFAARKTIFLSLFFMFAVSLLTFFSSTFYIQCSTEYKYLGREELRDGL